MMRFTGTKPIGGGITTTIISEDGTFPRDFKYEGKKLHYSSHGLPRRRVLGNYVLQDVRYLEGGR